MGNIAKRPNGKYRARYRDATGKEHARHFDRKGDAERWLAKQITRIADGTWIDPQQGRRTFGSFAQHWQTAQVHHRASTRSITSRRLDRITATFGERPLSAITRTEVQAWVTSLDLSPASVEAHYRLLAQVLLAAVDEQLIPSSPCRRINLPKREHSKPRIPTVDELAAIIDAAPEHSRASVILAAGTGLRVSELLGLTVDRVDFLRGVVTVDRQLVGSRAGVPRFGPPKTKGSHRTIPIPRDLVAVLAEHLARWPSDGVIFRNAAGLIWSRSKYSDEWRRWRTVADVEGVRFHDLRHFYASSLIAAGQSVKVVQERLGHTSSSTTLDVYGHLWPADEEATREAVSGALAAVLRTASGQ